MKAFYPVLKLQLLEINPLELQFVVDFWPKNSTLGRTGGVFEKPSPKAYLHVKHPNASPIEKLSIQSLASLLILNCNGETQTKEKLDERLYEWFRYFKNDIVNAAYYALENMQRNRKVTELLGVPAT